MAVAVVGTGNVGSTLGRAFARAGMEVRFGSRDPDAAAGAAGDSGARVVTVHAALDGADVVVIAVPGGRVAGFLREHAAALDGCLIVDAANRVGEAALNSSADTAELVPGARYARAFNSYGWEVFAQPEFDGERADLLYTAEARDQAAVGQLIEAVGLRPVYLGPGQADVLDTVLRLMFALFPRYGRRTALRLLTD
ncbi:MAG: NADPH-dependent F420 reductase [Nocardioidaceae bacterium]